jgi:cell wall-associated NlpC family hydrolase
LKINSGYMFRTFLVAVLLLSAVGSFKPGLGFAAATYQKALLFNSNEPVTFGQPSWGTITAAVYAVDNGNKVIKYDHLKGNSYAPGPVIRFGNSSSAGPVQSGDELQLKLDLGNVSRGQDVRILLNNNPSSYVIVAVDNTAGFQTYKVDLGAVNGMLGKSLTSLSIQSNASNGWLSTYKGLLIDDVNLMSALPTTPVPTVEPQGYEPFDAIFNGDLYFNLRPASWGMIQGGVYEKEGTNNSRAVRFDQLAGSAYAPTPEINFGTGKSISNLRARDIIQIKLDLGNSGSSHAVRAIFNRNSQTAQTFDIDGVSGYQTFDIPVSVFTSNAITSIQSLSFESGGPNGWNSDISSLWVDDLVVSKPSGTVTPELTQPPAAAPEGDPNPGSGQAGGATPTRDNTTEPTPGAEPFVVTPIFEDDQNFVFGGGWDGFTSELRSSGGVNNSPYVHWTRIRTNLWDGPEHLRFTHPIDISKMTDHERLQVSVDLGAFTIPNQPVFGLRLFFNNLSDNSVTVNFDNIEGFQTKYVDISSIASSLLGQIDSLAVLPLDGWPANTDIHAIKLDHVAIVDMDGTSREALPPKPVIVPTDHGVNSVWGVSDGEKIEKDDLTNVNKASNSAWDGHKIKVFGSRNEIVAFQTIVEASDAGILGMDASLPQLVQRGGTGVIKYTPPAVDPTQYADRPIEIFTENYLNVTQRTHTDFLYPYDNSHPANPTDPTGWKPVQLVPENATQGRGGFPITVQPRTNQGLWFELYIDKNLPAGTYEGTITIHADQQEVKVPIELEVLDFTLPDENSLDVMVYYEPYQVVTQSGTDWSYPLDPAYHRFAHRNRVEFVDHYDETSAQQHIGRFNGTDFTAANGYAGPGAGIGNTIIPRTFYGNTDDFVNEAQARTLSDSWMNFMHNNLPGKKTFLYVLDEQRAADFPGIQNIARNIKNNPGIGSTLPVLVTTGYNAALDTNEHLIDIWTTTSPHYDIDRAVVERAEGDKVWTYNGWRPYAGALLIDTPAVDSRVNPWANFKYGIDTYYYWAAVNWNRQNVWVNPRTFSQGSDYAMGDGVLVYPGQDVLHPDQDRGIKGPISTFQLANLRRGSQDHLYLTLAKKLGLNDVVNTALGAIVPEMYSAVGDNDAVHLPQTANPFEVQRYLIGKAIEKASKAATNIASTSTEAATYVASTTAEAVTTVASSTYTEVPANVVVNSKAQLKSSLNFRSEPSSASTNTVIRSAKRGESFTLLSQVNPNWYQAQDSQGVKGYINASSTALDLVSNAKIIAGIGLYTTPSNGTEIRKLSAGEEVLVVEKVENNWYKIKDQSGAVGYVDSKYVAADFSIIKPIFPLAERIERFIQEGKKYLGTTYEFGSKRFDTTTFDCSDFVQQSFWEATGEVLPSTSSPQGDYVKKLGQTTTDWSNLKRGDLMFFMEPRGTHLSDYAGIDKLQQTIEHVGIYLGDGQVMHARTPETGGVRIDNISGRQWEFRFLFGGSVTQ